MHCIAISYRGCDAAAGVVSHKRGQSQDDACVICFENQGDHVLLPCGHSGYCLICSKALLADSQVSKNCPVCRTPVTMFTRIPVDTPIGDAVRAIRDSAKRKPEAVERAVKEPGEVTGAMPQLDGFRWQALNHRQAVS